MYRISVSAPGWLGSCEKSALVIDVRGCGGLLKRMPKAGNKMTVLGSGATTEGFEACHSNHPRQVSRRIQRQRRIARGKGLYSHFEVGLSLEGTVSAADYFLNSSTTAR
jgi:hypothetical protein